MKTLTRKILTIIIGLLGIYVSLGPILPGLTPEYLPRTVQIIGGGLLVILLYRILDKFEDEKDE